MKNLAKMISSLAFILLGAMIFSNCTQGPKDVTEEITKINKEFMEAFNSGDAHAVATKYTLQGKLYPTNSDVIKGIEAIEGFWNSAMEMGIKRILLETLSAESYGRTVIEEGRYTLYAEEDQVADQGKYIVTWEKENGQWKLHRDIWNTSNPAPQPRASLNDTVWLIFNHVKPGKVKQFENFNFKYLAPAAEEIDAQAKRSARLLKPLKQNKDGTYTYVYLMDPAISGERYRMTPALTAKFGEDKARECMSMFRDCVKEREDMVAVQTAW